MTLDTIIDGVLLREGSTYTDRASDRGGPTKYGITLATLSDWRHPKPTTADDVKALTEMEARDILRYCYIVRPGLVKLVDPNVLELAVDCAVNHGPSEGVKLVQLAAHVFPDGVMGNETVSAANRMTPAVLYRRLCAARARYYGRIVTADPREAPNAAGWLNRLATFIENAP